MIIPTVQIRGVHVLFCVFYLDVKIIIPTVQITGVHVLFLYLLLGCENDKTHSTDKRSAKMIRPIVQIKGVHVFCFASFTWM